MRVLATLYEQYFNPSAPRTNPSGFEHRKAARAVILNGVGQVALLHATRHNPPFHKLPGGGIEQADEDELAALAREAREEIGCDIEVVAALGKVIEYRDRLRQVQTSYCYLARQVGQPRQTAFTEEERQDGFRVVWAADLDAAVATVQAGRLLDDPEKYVNPRDVLVLQTAGEYISSFGIDDF